MDRSVGLAPPGNPGDGFLGSLSAPQQEDLMGRGRRQRYRRGASLFVEGASSQRVFLLLSGRVKIWLLTEDGREVVLAMRAPGDLLGELSFLDGHPHSASASTVEPAEALVIAASDFRAFLEAQPAVAMKMLELLSRRLRDSDEKRTEFAAFDTVGRVARRLVELADRFGDAGEAGIRITLPMTQEELAGWTGASREAVSKALGTLRSLGWIETHRREITVLNPEGLRKRSR